MCCTNGGSNQVFGFTTAKFQDCRLGESLRHAAAKVPDGAYYPGAVVYSSVNKAFCQLCIWGARI